MFCKNCGNQLPDGAVFCGSCGTKVEAQAAPQQPAYEAPQQPAYTAPQPTYQQPAQAAPKANNPALDSLAQNTLIMGIVGLATGVAFGIPGIIISNIAKKKANEYVSCAGELSGKAKVGATLAKVGLPVSIGLTGFYALCFLIGFISGL